MRECKKSRPYKIDTIKGKPRERFLGLLRKGCTVGAAARGAGRSRDWAYDQREKDPEFRKLWDIAIEAGTDELEEEATRRALSGSDRLLMFVLKGRRPKKFRENIKFEYDIPQEVIDGLSMEQLEAIVRGEIPSGLTASQLRRRDSDQ